MSQNSGQDVPGTPGESGQTQPEQEGRQPSHRVCLKQGVERCGQQRGERVSQPGLPAVEKLAAKERFFGVRRDGNGDDQGGGVKRREQRKYLPIRGGDEQRK